MNKHAQRRKHRTAVCNGIIDGLTHFEIVRPDKIENIKKIDDLKEREKAICRALNCPIDNINDDVIDKLEKLFQFFKRASDQQNGPVLQPKIPATITKFRTDIRGLANDV